MPHSIIRKLIFLAAPFLAFFGSPSHAAEKPTDLSLKNETGIFTWKTAIFSAPGADGPIADIDIAPGGEKKIPHPDLERSRAYFALGMNNVEAYFPDLPLYKADTLILGLTEGGIPTLRASRGGKPVFMRLGRLTMDDESGGDAPKSAADYSAFPVFSEPGEHAVFYGVAHDGTVVAIGAPDAQPADGAFLRLRIIRPDGTVSDVRSGGKGRGIVLSASTVGLSGGGYTYVRFDNGKESSIIYTGIGRFGPNAETVEIAGMVIEERCGDRSNEVASQVVLDLSKAHISDLGPELFEALEVPGDERGFLLPDDATAAVG